jgi:hypothetical protein
MLCWDADRDVWRCDFIRRRQLASGDGETIGEAADRAWAATDQELSRVAHEARYDTRFDD